MQRKAVKDYIIIGLDQLKTTTYTFKAAYPVSGPRFETAECGGTT
jgi:hypothetical protein